MQGENLTFRKQLTELLNRYSKEDSSNTPDFVLADFLIGCLHVFNITVQRREKWYGRESEKLEKVIEDADKLSRELDEAGYLDPRKLDEEIK